MIERRSFLRACIAGTAGMIAVPKLAAGWYRRGRGLVLPEWPGPVEAVMSYDLFTAGVGWGRVTKKVTVLRGPNGIFRVELPPMTPEFAWLDVRTHVSELYVGRITVGRNS